MKSLPAWLATTCSRFGDVLVNAGSKSNRGCTGLYGSARSLLLHTIRRFNMVFLRVLDLCGEWLLVGFFSLLPRARSDGSIRSDSGFSMIAIDCASHVRVV